MANDNFLYLYEYLPWEEKEIEYVLKNVYDWQTDVAYGKNQWRMGDGQTAFINYIFHIVCKFMLSIYFYLCEITIINRFI